MGDHAYSIINPFAEQQLRQRLSRTLDQQKIFKAIDDDPALIGAAVIFIDARGNSVTLREFEPICHIKPIKVVLREPPRALSAIEYVSEVKSSPVHKFGGSAIGGSIHAIAIAVVTVE